MSRKSSPSAPATARRCQVWPLVIVLITVPAVPLAHTTCADGALMPRSLAVTPVSSTTQLGESGTTRPSNSDAATNARMERTLNGGARGSVFAVLTHRRDQQRHRRVDDDRDHQPADGPQVQRLDEDAGDDRTEDTADRQAQRDAQAVALLADEAEAPDRHQEGAGVHHDRERR